MEKLNLKQYGFVRYEDRDFSYDGNRYEVYMLGKVSITKSVSDGKLYSRASIGNGALPFSLCSIRANIDNGALPLSIYSKLPHYDAINALNEVSSYSITKKDLFKFAEDCKAYEKEYDDALSKIVYPSKEALEKEYAKLEAKILHEVADIRSKVTAKILNLDDYKFSSLVRYYHMLLSELEHAHKNAKDASLVYKTVDSISFMGDKSHNEPSYDYNQCLEILREVNN